ncbi:unnamed protein product [Durusdinium trenchii]|uniref:Uncharacterized protein n=1 Tax=Durusdinium trenchii TaxID=1381693 RepID=A0ABP0HEF9_9DINO
MSTIDELSLASGAPQDGPASGIVRTRCEPPVFVLWRSSGGDEADVLLHWHPALPDKLPDDPDEPICTVQLWVRNTAELLEARLQQHHLGRPLMAWTNVQLERLMLVMAQQTCGDSPHQDEVRLRRAPGRMVIDVHFRRLMQVGLTGPELGGCVVEILNAYASGSGSDLLRVLRSAAQAQACHQAALKESGESLEALRRETSRLEGSWTDAAAAAKKQHRGLLQRFALVLQAKIDKERSLHDEVQEKRWARMGVANVAALPPREVEGEQVADRGRCRGGRAARARSARGARGEGATAPRGRGSRRGRGRANAPPSEADGASDERSPSPAAKRSRLQAPEVQQAPGESKPLEAAMPSVSGPSHSLFDPDSQELHADYADATDGSADLMSCLDFIWLELAEYVTHVAN